MIKIRIFKIDIITINIKFIIFCFLLKLFINKTYLKITCTDNTRESINLVKKLYYQIIRY